MAGVQEDLVHGQTEPMDLDDIFDFNAFANPGPSPRLLPITAQDIWTDYIPENGDMQAHGFGLGISDQMMPEDGLQYSPLDFSQPVRQAVTSSLLIGGLSTSFLVSGGTSQSSNVMFAGNSPTSQPVRSSFAFESTRGAPLVRGRLPERAKKILNDWFHSNENYPYPTEHEERSLVQDTGLSLKQVKTYFVNARARFKKIGEPSIEIKNHKRSISNDDGVTATSPSEDNMEVAQRPLTPDALISIHRTLSKRESSDSMGRYLQNPTEGAQIDSIRAAAAVTPLLKFELSPNISRAPSRYGSEHNSQRTSVSGASRSSNSRSGRSSYSCDSRRRRKGKRRWSQSHASPHSPSSQASEGDTTESRYICTFCFRAFGSSYEWKRHEITHVPQAEKWICSPEEERFLDVCFFCGESDTYCTSHLDSHNLISCTAKTEKERTFNRKDHLMQHIKNAHLLVDDPIKRSEICKQLNNRLHKWMREATPEELGLDVLWCGFCCKYCQSWTARRQHLIDHFRSGANMAQWQQRFESVALPSASPTSSISGMLIAHPCLSVST